MVKIFSKGVSTLVYFQLLVKFLYKIPREYPCFFSKSQSKKNSKKSKGYRTIKFFKMSEKYSSKSGWYLAVKGLFYQKLQIDKMIIFSMLDQNLEYFGTRQLLLENEELLSHFTYCWTNKKNMRKNHKVRYAILFIKNFWCTFLCLQSSKTKITKKKETFSDAMLFVSKKQKQHKNAPIFYWNPSIKKQKKSSKIKHKYQNCSVGPPSSDPHYFL